MNFQNYIGKPLGTVIDEICSAKIEDWKNSIEEVSLSDKNLISSNTRGPKIFILGAAETYEERQASIGRVELAKELKSLFTELQEGRLSVQVEKYPLDDEKPKIIALRSLFWKRQWRIDDVGGEASITVWNKDGTQEETKYLLGEIQLAGSSVRAPVSPAVEGSVKQDGAKIERRVRGKSTDDEPYFVMMENLLRHGHKTAKWPAKPWRAAKILVDSDKVVSLDGSQPDSVIKRITDGYKKTARPQTAAEARRSAPITQK